MGSELCKRKHFMKFRLHLNPTPVVALPLLRAQKLCPRAQFRIVEIGSVPRGLRNAAIKQTVGLPSRSTQRRASPWLLLGKLRWHGDPNLHGNPFLHPLTSANRLSRVGPPNLLGIHLRTSSNFPNYGPCILSPIYSLPQPLALTFTRLRARVLRCTKISV